MISIHERVIVPCPLKNNLKRILGLDVFEIIQTV